MAVDQGKSMVRELSIEQVNEYPLDPEHPDQTVFIGAQLEPAMCDELLEFLRKNKEVFAWSHLDMPVIDPKVITHSLHVDPSHKPVR